MIINANEYWLFNKRKIISCGIYNVLKSYIGQRIGSSK